MAFDLNPLSFVGDIYKSGKMEKYYKLFVSCCIASFVGFWGTFGTVGAGVIGSGKPVGIALAWAFFSAAVVMSTSVLLTVRKSGLWKDLSVVLPSQLEKIVAESDVTALPQGKPGV